jgi:hypothetical protein
MWLGSLLLFASPAVPAVTYAAVGLAVDVFLPLLFLPLIFLPWLKSPRLLLLPSLLLHVEFSHSTYSEYKLRDLSAYTQYKLKLIPPTLSIS